MTEFYYIDDVSKQQCGPFAPNVLLQKGVRSNTMVWRTGMTDWVEAGTVEELAQLFGSDVNSAKNTTAGDSTQQQQQQQQQQQGSPNGNNQQYANNNRGQQPNQGGYNPNAGGYSQNRFDVRPLPKNYLLESILVTLFCCLPLGIAGIVNATKVETFYAIGDYESAEQSAADAKKWCKYALIGGVICFVLFIVVYVVLPLLMVAGAVAGTAVMD